MRLGSRNGEGVNTVFYDVMKYSLIHKVPTFQGNLFFPLHGFMFHKKVICRNSVYL